MAVKRILLLDNFDSFAWNLQHYIDASGAEVTVQRNNLLIPPLNHFDGLLISPGPGLPQEAGIMMDVIGQAIEKELPMLGVCLGMQGIAEHFGGKLRNLSQIVHGQSSLCAVNNQSSLYVGLPEQIETGRYHSWVVDTALPDVLEADAWIDDIIMGFHHTSSPVWAVQYHPESILTPHGKQIIRNWLSCF